LIYLLGKLPNLFGYSVINKKGIKKKDD